MSIGEWIDRTDAFYCQLCGQWVDDREWEEHEECRARLEDDEEGRT
jgi:hypothetical protein